MTKKEILKKKIIKIVEDSGFLTDEEWIEQYGDKLYYDMLLELFDQQKDEATEGIKKDLEIVLDFIERWNKQDKEQKVAESARKLDGFLTDDFLKSN